jgi:D-lactate dehydrogenase
MLMLMSLRKLKLIQRLAAAQDFSLREVRGTPISRLTVGIMGTGKIGTRVIQHLSGFGCKLLAYDTAQNPEAKKHAVYVTLNELFAQSDIISLHMPATSDTHHIINAEALAKMKDGVYIINTARGMLIDTKALLDAIERQKIGGAALDVVEDEAELYYKVQRATPLKNRELAILKSYPNVIITPHTAFFTDEAVSNMVEISIKSCIEFLNNEPIQWEIRE